MRFDLTDLRLFVHVIDAQSITHGAERAGMALGSASERIRGMEQTSGTRLLERNPRGVRPTPAGQAVLHHARLVIGQLEQMRGELAQYADGLRGHVRVLANTAALADLLPHALAGFLSVNPAIDVDLEERTSPEIVVEVANGLADFGVLADTVDLGKLETIPLKTDRLVLITPDNHPLATRATIAYQEILSEHFVSLRHGSALQTLLSTNAARLGAPLKIRVRVSALETVCRMVASGAGIAVVPEGVARQADQVRTRVIKLEDTWSVRRLTICARQFAGLPLHARKLVDYLRSSGQEDRSSLEP